MDHPSAWLEFPSGERIFLQGACTIGRGPENRVVIASDRVSRRHAILRQDERGEFSLMDMGSSNGTYLNGQRLNQSTKIRDGWIIEIGLQKMVFRTPPKSAAESRVDETRESDCWLLAIAGVQRGAREASQELGDKTHESWTERCQRVIGKFRGHSMRALDDSLLAFWPASGTDFGANTIIAALNSLRALQKQTEEFRFALHCGEVRLRRSAAGDETPTGAEVITAMQLDRLASLFACAVLITEQANERLGPTLPTRRLSIEEMRGYRGTMRFFTVQTSL